MVNQVLKVLVGSENKAKIRAAESALKLIFPDQFENIEIIGCKVASGVSDQPLSDEESIKGATQRAKASLELYPDADYAIGMEGGVNYIKSPVDKWFECGWIVVVSKDLQIGIGCTARFELPKNVMHEILINKKELAQVMDEITGQSDVRSNDGAMGVLTNSLLKRDHVYSEAVIFAFSRFITPYFN